MSDNPKLRVPDEVNSPGGMLWGEVTDYILSTAATWKGPIGHFHLTLDKRDARNVLSVCWQGLKKTSPTTFEFTADNFAPKPRHCDARPALTMRFPMKNFLRASLLLGALALVPAALADDSSAMLGAGGIIVLTKNTDIRYGERGPLSLARRW